MSSKITEITTLNEKPWKEDLERLLKLIRSLGRGGDGPLTEEQMTLLNNNTGESPSSGRTSSSATSGSTGYTGRKDDQKSSGQSKKGSLGSAVSAGRRSSRGSSGGRFWLWFLLALVLLLAAAGIFFLVNNRKNPGSNTGDTATMQDHSSSDSGNAARTGSMDTDNQDGQEGGGSEGSSEGTVSETGDNLSSDSNQGTAGSSGDTADTVVDLDRAPTSSSEALAYLDILGRVQITEADIHLAANEIAVLNGYRDLDYRVFSGNDPDWIYPQTNLNMPDNSIYTVRNGDTIWFLAARRVRSQVIDELDRLDRAVSILEESGSDSASRSQSFGQLERIASDSPSENMRILASGQISRFR